MADCRVGQRPKAVPRRYRVPTRRATRGHAATRLCPPLLEEVGHAFGDVADRLVLALRAGPVAGELLRLELICRQGLGGGAASHDEAVLAGELAELDEVG